MSIDLHNETTHRVDLRELNAVSRHVFAAMGVHSGADLAITLVDEPAIATLHEQWMDLEGPTDVMSFPMDELRPAKEGEPPASGVLGDIVLCPSVAQKQADAAGHSLQDELLLLTVHGILHLLGYDHGEPDEHKEMFDLQRELLVGYLHERGRPAPNLP